MKSFKDKQENTTKINRDRVIRNHILPKFGETPINQITTGDIQNWFDELAENYAKETILKIRTILSPVFDAAVEDGILSRNPVKSKRITVTGKDTVHHKAIPPEKMAEIRSGMGKLEDIRDRRMTALLATTGMRFEEVLGIRWEDIDIHENWISIERAVVHPTRNLPEVKTPKTKSSARRIPLPKDLLQLLAPRESTGFLIYSNADPSHETPVSYTEARRIFNRIRDRFNIKDYTAHDFRDTCATEWREQGIPLDVISRMLGHTKTEVTERRYVKYRGEIYDGVRDVMEQNLSK